MRYGTALLMGALLSAGCTTAVANVTAPGVATPSSSPSSKVPNSQTLSDPKTAPPGEVVYHTGARGYMALPPEAITGTKPAVVMIHEWWGLNQHIKDQANLLAQEGYVVLAVDLYGNGKVAADSTEAQASTRAVGEKPAEAASNLASAVAFLKARPDVKPNKVASLGWCFGGGWSLKLVQAQKDLSAGVIYYGALAKTADEVRGLPPILGIFGATDANPSASMVAEFKTALTTAGVPHEIHSYEGAGHAFANPSGGERYKAEAAKDAWAKTLAFLKAKLAD